MGGLVCQNTWTKQHDSDPIASMYDIFWVVPPLAVRVTTRLTLHVSVRGSLPKPSFPLLLWGGPHPMYDIFIYIYHKNQPFMDRYINIAFVLWIRPSWWWQLGIMMIMEASRWCIKGEGRVYPERNSDTNWDLPSRSLTARTAPEKWPKPNRKERIVFQPPWLSGAFAVKIGGCMVFSWDSWGFLFIRKYPRVPRGLTSPAFPMKGYVGLGVHPIIPIGWGLRTSQPWLWEVSQPWNRHGFLGRGHPK